MVLKPRTKYRCPNEECPYLGPYTGANETLPDGCGGCGALLIEVVDDGTRYRLSWEMISATSHPNLYNGDRPIDLSQIGCTIAVLPDEYWHAVVKEHDNEYDARQQWDGLHRLVSQREFIRNIKIEKSTVVWQEVDW